MAAGGPVYDSAVGIVRNFATRILAPYEHTYPAILVAFQTTGIQVTEPGNPVVGEAKRSVRNNRWAATVAAGVRPETPRTTVIEWSVDMLGDKHREVITEILDATNTPIDDLGVSDALARLGKMGRLFGRLEARALSDHLHLDERVLELAQGVYSGRQGMLVLTKRRLFFFDKGLSSAKVEEFDFGAICSLGWSKKLGGESIDIAISGRSAEIKQVAHGRAETFITAFRQVRYAAPVSPPPQPAVSAPTADLAGQIRKLAELRDAGILTEGEFAAKKADLLSRM